MDPIREYFDTEARRYMLQRYDGSSCDQLAYQARRHLALQMLGPGPGRVLDIGSGPGVLTAALRLNGHDVCALDVSLEMLREARRDQKFGAAVPRFIQGRLPELPFVAASFDSAMSIGVLAYLDDSVAALREIRRVLKTSGVAVLQVSNAVCPTARLHSLLRRWYRRSAHLLGGQAYPHLDFPLKAFRLGPLRALLRSSSFEVEAVAFYDFRPPLLQWVVPRIALSTARWLQGFEHSRAIRLLAEGIVLKVRAC